MKIHLREKKSTTICFYLQRFIYLILILVKRVKIVIAHGNGSMNPPFTCILNYTSISIGYIYYKGKVQSCPVNIFKWGGGGTFSDMLWPGYLEWGSFDWKYYLVGLSPIYHNQILAQVVPKFCLLRKEERGEPALKN